MDEFITCVREAAGDLAGRVYVRDVHGHPGNVWDNIKTCQFVDVRVQLHQQRQRLSDAAGGPRDSSLDREPALLMKITLHQGGRSAAADGPRNFGEHVGGREGGEGTNRRKFFASGQPGKNISFLWV